MEGMVGGEVDEMDRINIVQRKGVRESCSVMEGRDVRNESIFVLDDPFHVRNYLSGFCHFSNGFGLVLWFCCLLEFLPSPGCCSLPAACGEVLGLDLSSNLRNHCGLCVSCRCLSPYPCPCFFLAG
jgi:hypothetical protein